MSAIELIEQVKALPPREQAAFAELLRQWRPEPSPESPAVAPASAPWPDFVARLRRIYGNKVTSDSQALISELRGER